MDANRTSSAYELKGELARLCLPTASREPERKLAWVNSVCIFFLLIGIAGAQRGMIDIKPVPPLREIVPIVVQPMPLRPQKQEVVKKIEPRQNQNSPARVVVALPDAPDVHFAVPTIGTLVAPTTLASAPPLEPLRTAMRIGDVGSTGNGGERPEPPYPPIAKATGEQGTVVLRLTGDAAGNVVSVEVKKSSGFPVLDHATVEFIKRHWRLPVNAGTRTFETSITYQLELN